MFKNHKLCTAVIFICLLKSFSVHCQTCSNCISVFDCYPAKVLLDRKDKVSTNTLSSAFCGFNGDNPSVCCDDLAAEEELDYHPNLLWLPRKCGRLNVGRIFGGTEVGLYDHPWIALISTRSKLGLAFRCAGSVINDRYILTAAHCVVGKILAGVRIGEHDITTPIDCVGSPPTAVCESTIQDMEIKEEIIHKDYEFNINSTGASNDIALLRLKRQIDFKPRNARPICLPVTREQRSRVDTEADVAGWGKTERGIESNVLLKVQVPILPQSECYKIIKGDTIRNYSMKKLCAGEYSKDSCSGDSGGPLLVIGSHNGVRRYIQRGIVSYGPARCGTNSPGIYTDVTKYMKWILDNIRE